MIVKRLCIAALSASVMLSAPLPVWAVEDDFTRAVTAYKDGNPMIAVRIFRTLAVAGDAHAQMNLSLLLLRGEGVPRNDKEALYWAWRARFAGTTQAITLVETLTPAVTQDGIAQVAAKLEKDLMVRIKEGDRDAMLALGRVKHEVRPEPDYVGAVTWMTVAAAFGVRGAGMLRDAVSLELDDQQRIVAQDRAMDLFDEYCSEESGCS